MPDLKEQLHATLAAARDLAGLVEAEGRDFTPEERDRVKKALDDAGGLKARIEEADRDADLRKALADFQGVEAPAPVPQPAGYAPPRGKSLGQQFVESPEYKTLMASFGGRIPEGAKVHSAPFGLKTLLTGNDSNSAGVFVTTDRTNIFEPLARRELVFRDLFAKRTTTSDTVEWVLQTSRENAAAPVAEATATGDASGVKPEGGFEFDTASTTVKTVAEWTPATRQALSDAAQLRGLIDDELRGDLAEEEENQLLNGDGRGSNLTGLMHTSGLQTQGYSATVTGLDPFLETTLMARTKVRTIGRSTPSAYALHPLDWERVALARLAKNPSDVGEGTATPRLHGLPVVQSEALDQGVGLVADFSRAVIWDREQANIIASDSHADFFIRNLVAVRGEERIAFGVVRPAAFVVIDLSAGS